MKRFVDSIQNFVSGLGTSKDKTTANQHYFMPMGAAQIEAAYRGGWIPRKIIDIPAKDATREWRAWQAEADQISEIEDEESRHRVQLKVRSATIKARLFGGAGIVLGVDGTGNMDEELNLERVREGSLRFLHVLDRYELGAGEIDTDLASPYYGRPSYYTVTSGSGLMRIHPSRVVQFQGSELPSTRQQNDGWGDSVMNAINDAIMDATAGAKSLAILLQESNVDVIQIPGFMDSIGTAEYKSRLIERFQLAALGQSVVRAKILDSSEVWNRIATSFAGIPESVKLMLEIAAGAGDVPVTRLLGTASSGLNATGEGDIRNYYDNVADQQKNVMQPAMYVLDEVLIRSALGGRPDEVHYNWNPLWQPTAGEKADVRLKNSQSLTNIYNTGLIEDEALRVGAQNMLIEDGLLPGFEQALDDIDEVDIDEGNPEVVNQFSGSSAASPEEKPQDQALNGAQITAIQGIVTSVALKQMPPETAIKLIMVGFPLITEEIARGIIDPIASFESAPAPAPARGGF